MKKPLKALVATCLFAALLLAVYFIHVRYLPVNVVFYSAIEDGLVAATISAAFVFLAAYFVDLNAFEKVQLTLIWVLLGYVYAISIPTVIDRSLSLYMLEKMQQRGGGILQSRFEDVFTKEFSREHRLVDARLTEQMESGTVRIVNGCVLLTERGDEIASASRYFRLNFLPKKRLLMGKYSDELTDPFRGSDQVVDYGCK